MVVQRLALSYYDHCTLPNKEVVRDYEAFDRMVREIWAASVFSFDYETSGLAYWRHARAVGISFAVFAEMGRIKSWYVPFRHHSGESQLDIDQIGPVIGKLLARRDAIKIAHNLKFEDHFSRREGWVVTGPTYDTMPAGALYDENIPHKLETRAETLLGIENPMEWNNNVQGEIARLAKAQRMKIGEYKDQYGYSQVPINLLGLYACFDTEFTLGLYRFYENWGVSRHFARLFATENALPQIICDMEEEGLPVDVEYILRLKELTAVELDRLRPLVRQALGDINVGSDEQLRHLMFGQMGLPVISFTKRGRKPSVDGDVLKHYSQQYPVFDLVRRYREAEKIHTTYTTSILHHCDDDGICHCDFQQVGTNCMPAGELVLTSRGYVPVETVRRGDCVLTHKGRVRSVVESGLQPEALLVRVTLANGLSLRTTENHAYQLDSGRWVEAGQLVRGMRVRVHGDIERWRKIEEWGDFSVSSWGRVRNDTTDHYLKLQPKGKWGHLKVQLYRNGAQTRKYGDRRDFPVHRLVANAFVQKQSGCSEVCHLNGIAWDNTASNLSWGNRVDNARQAVMHGTMSWGDLPHAKLDEDTSSVVSILREGAELVYGLTVEEDHSHVTGGIVTHNTGRLSCRNPNLQNMYKDDDDRALAYSGKKIEDGGVDPWSIRRAFIVRTKGEVRQAVRLFFDYSQIELRVLAFYTRDPTMIQTYLDGGDIHEATQNKVGEMMGTEPIKRRLAKIINFGLSYCLSALGLSRQAGMELEQAEEFMQSFFQGFPAIPEFRERFWASIRRSPEQCFVNLFGRTRRVPRILSMDKAERGRAERQAIGTLIQGTAAELTKESLVRLHGYIRENNLPMKIVNTVHDEIQLDLYDPRFLVEVCKGIKYHMENYSEFDPIPVKVDGEYSLSSWTDKQGLPA